MLSISSSSRFVTPVRARARPLGFRTRENVIFFFEKTLERFCGKSRVPPATAVAMTRVRAVTADGARDDRVDNR